MTNKHLQREKIMNALAPVLISGSTAINGVIVDRKGYESAVVAVITGATTGTPTGTQLAFIIQHGDASNLSDAATFATLTGIGTAAANLTDGGVYAQTGINLATAKRYIRLVTTPTFTDGTSPKVNGAAVFTLGSCNVNPPSGVTESVLPQYLNYSKVVYFGYNQRIDNTCKP